MVGPKGRVCPLDQSAALRRVQKLFGEYLIRKYDGVSSDTVKNLTNDICGWKGCSSVKFLCGSGIQIPGTFWNLVGEAKRNPMNRPHVFVAIEMDGTETETDLYYGRILRLMEVDVRPPNGHLPQTEMHCKQIVMHRLGTSVLQGRSGSNVCRRKTKSCILRCNGRRYFNYYAPCMRCRTQRPFQFSVHRREQSNN